MQITEHAQERIHERGFDETILTIIEEAIPSRYLRNSNQIELTRKYGRKIVRVLRKTAGKVEKHIGTKMILDSSGSTLLTVYRKK